MTKKAAPLKGLWGQRYEDAWRPRFNAVFDSEKSIPVTVVLWGPGLGSESYAKRDEIGAALVDEHTSVATPEALMDADERFGELGDVLLAEGIQAEGADLVIALAVADRKVTGVHAELTRFGDHERIGPKIRLFNPRLKRQERNPLLLAAAYAIPEASRFDYTTEQFVDCQNMRAKARGWVNEVRRAKFLSAIKAGSLAQHR